MSPQALIAKTKPNEIRYPEANQPMKNGYRNSITNTNINLTEIVLFPQKYIFSNLLKKQKQLIYYKFLINATVELERMFVNWY